MIYESHKKFINTTPFLLSSSKRATSPVACCRGDGAFFLDSKRTKTVSLNLLLQERCQAYDRERRRLMIMSL